MSTKPIAPRSGKPMTNWMNLDGSPVADNLNLAGYRDDGFAKSTTTSDPQTAQAPVGGPVNAPPTINVWINEFHYDNTSTDVGEFVEVAGAAGTSLAGWSIILYNGANGQSYDTVVLTGTIPDQGNGFGTLTFPRAGIQNGAPDGIVLYTGTSVIEFISYEGSFTATNGVANGLTSTSVGAAVVENDPGTPVGASIGRIGSGSQASDFTWAVISDDTPGGVNNGQTFVAIGGGGTPTISINDVSKVEGDSGTVTFTFTVSLNSAAGVGGVTFDIATANGTATTADNDYVARSLTTQTIPEGSTSYTFDVTVNGDDVPETNETFLVNLTNVVGATTGDAQGQGTITNDDAFGALSIGNVTLAEGNSGTTNFVFTVTRAGGDDGTVSATYTVHLPGGAGGADATDIPGTLTGTVTFLDGEVSKTVTVGVAGDLIEEPTETFTVVLTSPQGGATIGTGTGTGTITNDDSPPVASIGDASIAEGADSVSYLVFNVTLDHSATGIVTVDYATSNGTAIAGSDYVAHNGTVSFAPGETSQTISIPIIGDTISELSETFGVTLSNAVNGSVGDGSGIGTITNDDGSAYYNLASGSFTQNWTNTGLITANDDWSGVPYIIGYLGDIDAGSVTNVDPRTLTGANVGAIDVIANLTSTTNTSGGVGEFANVDPDDNVNLENPTIGLQGSGTADAPSIVLYMDASGRSDIRVQANLRDIDATGDDAAQQIAVQYRTSPNGAWVNAPGGYFADVTTGGSATQITAVDITLPAGANGAATLEIRFLTTNAPGSDEWVGIDDIVVSSQQSGPVLSIANTAVFEGDSLTTPITFTVTRAGASTGEVTADYSVNFPGGINGANSDDFAVGQAFTGQVHFADGQTTATITLNVAGDVGPELDENFTVTLSNAVGGAISDGVATGTIVNDDGQPPLVTVNDVTVTELDSGTSLMTFIVTRTGGTGAFDVNYETQDGSATAGSDYDATSGILHFANGDTTQTVSVTIHGDTASELSETLNLVLSNPTNFALLADATGVGTIAGDDPIFIHDIQGTSYFSPILAAEGIHAFNIASAGAVIVRAIVTAVDDDGPRQGYYLSEEVTDWDGNSYTSEGIFVMTRDDNSNGAVVAGVTVGDLVEISGHVMEYQAFGNMPRTVLVNPTGLDVISHGNALPTLTLTNIPNEVLTGVTPDYFDSNDDPNDSFDASTYALSYFESVEGMLVTVPHMVVADGFVQGGQASPFFQAYSLDSANPDQINSRGGYTIAGDPPFGPPDTPGTGDDTHNGGLVLHDGDVNPDVIQLEYGGFGMDAPAGLHDNASMGDQLGDITGIIDFDFTDRVLYVTDSNPGSFVDTQVTQETTLFGNDSRSLTMGAFNVNNLDPSDGAARFTAIANAIAHNLNAPDIVSIEEIQDNNGATSDGNTDASTTWQMLVDALNLATGAHYQWVDQAPVNGAEGGEPGGNIRVGFLYNTDRVQLGDLDANATLAERREFTDRVGDGVRDAGDRIAFDDSMIASEINTGDWSATRRSLLGEFTFHGNTVYATANHFTAKGGSGEFWQFDQDLTTGDPLNAGWDKRNDQAQDIYTMLNLIQQSNPNAGVISAGDYNDFYFYNPLTTVTGYTMADGTERVGGARFDNLTLTLPEAERYTYTFDGRTQAIDHIIVNDLLSGIATYDVAHLNTGFNPANTLAISDHDPGIANFDFRSLGELLVGTVNDDLIEGFGGNDTLIGGAGADLLDGGTGADLLIGGTGNDTYYIEQATDQVVEAVGGGNDRIATSVSYALAAGSEVELVEAITFSATDPINLVGNEFANRLVGNAGVNFLFGGAGADTMIGGAGNDTYYVDNAGDMIEEVVGGGSDRVAAQTSLTLAAGSEVELLEAINLTATDAFNLTGNEFANTITGNAGVNILDGGGAADVLQGAGGDDYLVGGAGDDAMYGGAGNDTFYVADAGDLTIEATGEGNDRVATSISYALAAGSSIELLEAINQGATDPLNLTGNELAQTIVGNAGANIITGGGGADQLQGLGGNDTYYVSSPSAHVFENVGGGNDAVYASSSFTLDAGQEVELLLASDFTATTPIALTGNEFGQTIIGTAGNNVLDGKGGNDSLVGLGGADIFAFTSALGANNVDVVSGFEHGTDKIALDDAIFTQIGALNANAFVTGTQAADSSDRIIYDNLTGQLFYDADGTGGGAAAVQFATLNPGLALTASDFMVI